MIKLIPSEILQFQNKTLDVQWPQKTKLLYQTYYRIYLILEWPVGV